MNLLALIWFETLTPEQKLKFFSTLEPTEKEIIDFYHVLVELKTQRGY